jgi:putative acetyltransferase
MGTTFIIRPIDSADNTAVAHIIRTVMTEFGAVGKGFSIEDPEVDAMFESYNQPRSLYLVVTDGETVLGCGGIAPLKGGDDDTCELKKMYFLPKMRGRGAGMALMAQLESAAQTFRFKVIYLETLDRMEQANILYKKSGFIGLNGPMGNTGHTSCGLFYAKNI